MKYEKQLICGVPNGFESLLLAKKAVEEKIVLFIASNDNKLNLIKEQILFCNPNIDVLMFPAWDTIFYDRVSPHKDIEGIRLKTLSTLCDFSPKKPTVILTSLPAVLGKLPPREFFLNRTLKLSAGQSFDLEKTKNFLSKYGYVYTSQVSEMGEYAIRGGIVDIFPVGSAYPVRIDLFGDDIESIRTFDVLTQRTIGAVDDFCLSPAAEYVLDEESIARFRTGYRELFGVSRDDFVYETVSAGKTMDGIEHWLALFFEKMDTFFDYLPSGITVYTDNQNETVLNDKTQQIQSYYQARLEGVSLRQDGAFLYQPLPPDRMFLSKDDYDEKRSVFKTAEMTPFVVPNQPDAGGRIVENFASARQSGDVLEKLTDFIKSSSGNLLLGMYSEVAVKRICDMLATRAIFPKKISAFIEAKKNALSVMTVPFENGFSSPTLTILTEADIFGEKLVRTVKRKKKQENFIEDISTLNVGDLVIHIKHGLGRYEGLKTMTAGGVCHDFLQIVYSDSDKLFVPVENLDVLTRYGSDENAPALDKLGGGAWEAKKSKVKKNLLEMAEKLIEIAAKRFAIQTPKIDTDVGLYNEFCARFPYVETQDQLKSISAIMDDFSSGHPMDRLVCGDVGFGKTEVALRAAFIAAMSGQQVAVVVPTTLLARQHYENFAKRFKGFPLRIGRLSRLVSAKEREKTKKELADGSLDIVVGTHAVLSKSIAFKNLGLLIIDEEQHFGVAHKERLKEMKSGVHVLTLTATPIPRTLQMSLTGVRELSIMATPPVDRLAVSTFVVPFDSMIIKEAIMREYMRGGQVFYVCPRISDMPDLLTKLNKIVPEVKVVAAHGQMAAGQIEKIMLDFADKKYDVLLATSIIESGLDMPNVNTMIVHKAEMFGLAALYQLRGRVGRSKVKAYAYLTTPDGKVLTPIAHKRLSVMQSLDSLGAGFTLASHDLDIRGAGNLLGQEQSGHIKEVGVELYQRMLEEAVASLKAGSSLEEIEQNETWSPQISVGVSVLIPENYVSDLSVRMKLYHELSNIENEDELLEAKNDMLDRFGDIPEEVENLFKVVEMKTLCLQAHIEKIDAGPKGATIVFHKNYFPNPAGLVGFINSQMGLAKLTPEKMTITRSWSNDADRVSGVYQLLKKFAQMAKEG